MKERLDYAQIAPDAVKAMRELERFVAASGLEHPLCELLKTRVSQINGCAYCLDMHTKDARKAGETEQRLYALSAWREAPGSMDTHFFEDSGIHPHKNMLQSKDIAAFIINILETPDNLLVDEITVRPLIFNPPIEALSAGRGDKDQNINKILKMK